MKLTRFKGVEILLVLIFALPCSGQDTVKIMPLGNSITEGYTDGTLTNPYLRGYRYGLRFLLKNAGYSVDFVGSESSGSAYFSDCQHAGIGGSRDQYVARLLTDGYDERNGVQILDPPRPYLDEYNPDIILLHIGTNDITHEPDPISIQQVSDILDLIDQYEIRAQKVVVVFLALIINRKKPWDAKATLTSNFNNYIKAMAESRIAAGDNIVIVDMEHDAGFVYTDEDMSNDGEGLHPNSEGYNKMASLWFTSIFDNYNTSPVISSIPDQVNAEGDPFNVIMLDDYVTDIEDPDEDIVWTIEQLDSSNLNIIIDENRQVSVIPKDSNWNGTQGVIFTATDKGRNSKYIKSDVDTVYFTVTPVNDPPVITSTPVLEAYISSLYTYEFTATDIDNPVVVRSVVKKPDWLSFNEATGVLSGIPLPGSTGKFEVILRASDGIAITDQDFFITVLGSDGFSDIASAGIKIYPVPAENYLTIKSDKIISETDLELIDASGVVKKRVKIAPGQLIYILNLDGVENGMYLIHIKNEVLNHVGRLIISK